MTALLGLGAFVLALFALLCVPVELTLFVERHSRIRARLSVRWMFGMARFRVPFRKLSKKRKPPRLEKRKKKRRTAVRFAPRAARAIRNAPFRRRFLQFVWQLLSSIRFREAALWLRLGLEDPADTGWLCGAMAPLTVWMDDRPSFEVQFDYTGPALEFDAHGRLSLVPAQLGWVTVLFLISPATLRMVQRQIVG